MFGSDFVFVCVRNGLGWKVVFGVLRVCLCMCAKDRILWFLFLVIRSQVSENKKRNKKIWLIFQMQTKTQKPIVKKVSSQIVNFK